MKTALLVIDVQNEVVRWLPAERQTAFLALLRGVIREARERGIPLVYVRHQDAFLRADTDGWRIADDVAPQPGDPIVEKRFRDAFRETNLAEVLDILGVGHLVVCGMQTEFCIDATVREGERRGYRMTLIGDAHATYDTDDLTEQQIVAFVNRVSADGVASVVPANVAFASVDAA
jgi:nicotinamidase-related amidase